MTNRTETEYFTFGSNHMSNHHDLRGPLRDHWVAVELPISASITHRAVFFDLFAVVYLPYPTQWGFQYPEAEFKPEYFPLGELCRIIPNASYMALQEAQNND